jgi:hypothetical protein
VDYNAAQLLPEAFAKASEYLRDIEEQYESVPMLHLDAVCDVSNTTAFEYKLEEENTK